MRQECQRLKKIVKKIKDLKAKGLTDEALRIQLPTPPKAPRQKYNSTTRPDGAGSIAKKKAVYDKARLSRNPQDPEQTSTVVMPPAARDVPQPPPAAAASTAQQTGTTSARQPIAPKNPRSLSSRARRQSNNSNLDHRKPPAQPPAARAMVPRLKAKSNSNHSSPGKKQSADSAASQSAISASQSAASSSRPSAASAEFACTSDPSPSYGNSNGRSNPLPLLYAIDLIDAPEQLLSPTQRQHQQLAQSMFDQLNSVAAHPTHRPMYSTLSAVNILPRRLRGMTCCDFHAPSPFSTH